MKKMTLALGMLLTASASAVAVEHLGSVDRNSIDNSIAPGEDFYRHVNNGWIKAHPLTDEYARYGMFNVLNDEAEKNVKDIVTNLGDGNPAKGTNAYKVWTLYSQGMDSVRRNNEGVAPILDDLKKIENAKPEEMDDLFMWLHANYSSPFFGAGPMENLANSKEYAMYVSGGSLGMGDRDYYLLNDKENTRIREAYKKLITGQMMNAGFSKKDANRIMKNVMKIETAIADSTWTREESRNIPAMYNPRTLAQLKEQYPHIDWDTFFPATMEIATPEMVIVTNPNTVKQADNLIASLSDREKKDYYLWKYVAQAAPFLSDKFSDTSFEFSKVLSGVKEMRPRWKRALGTADGYMGEAIGQLYVEKFFPESSKEQMLKLVGNLKHALGKHIINLPWMSDDTKVKALEKLMAFTVKIGYPDKWKDYSEMEIDEALPYYRNAHNARMWHQKEQLKKWGKPVDKSEWGMTPQTVNAYYNPMANEIVFPAAILQPPFFNPEASDAENYGGIGVVIGHEMSHGFDDQGSQFDAEGNMTNWWTPEDKAAFEKLTKGLAAQFDKIEILPGLMANGSYTLGENIGDQGGLRVSHTAFLDSQKAKGVDIEADSAKIDGFTPEQAFYLNYAYIWANNIRDAEKRNLTIGDVHSLAENRVNVTLRNIAPFLKAFGIKPGDKLYLSPEEQVVIW